MQSHGSGTRLAPHHHHHRQERHHDDDRNYSVGRDGDHGYRAPQQQVRFAPSPNASRREAGAFDWPELQAAVNPPPPPGRAGHYEPQGGGGGFELDARSSLEPIPAGRRDSDDVARRRGPDQARLNALAVPRRVGNAAAAVDSDGPTTRTGGPAGGAVPSRPLPRGAIARKPTASSALPPLQQPRRPVQPPVAAAYSHQTAPAKSPPHGHHQVPPHQPMGSARHEFHSPPPRRVGTAPEDANSTPRRAATQAEDPHTQRQPTLRSAAAAVPAPLSTGHVLRAKSGAPPPKRTGELSPLPRVAGLAPAAANAAHADFERHKKVAASRTAAVDARVNKMLAEIDRQRDKIDRVMNDQGTFAERMREAEVERKAAARDRAERLKQRELEHVQRKEALVAKKRNRGPLAPMAGGVPRFGPDATQPVTAIAQRGTSIAFAAPSSPDKAAPRSPVHHHAQPQVRSPHPPSPTKARGAAPHSRPAGAPLSTHSPSPGPEASQDGGGSSSVASSPDVRAARERLRLADEQRAQAAAELLAAERRAAALAFVKSRAEAEAILDGPVRVLQAFMWRRRAVRAACIRIIARRKRVAEKERERRLLRDINPNYEPSDDDDGDDGAAPACLRDDDDDDEEDGEDDDDGESLDGVGLIESEDTGATFSEHPSAASLLNRPRRRSSVTTVADDDGTTSPQRRHPHRGGASSMSPPRTRDQSLANSPLITGGAAGLVPLHDDDDDDDDGDDDGQLDTSRVAAARLDVIGAIEGAVMERLRDIYDAS